MLNLYEAVRTNPSYSKLEIGNFLFAEYTCGASAQKLPAWTETDYIVHVVTGKKTWHTTDGIWRVSPGETLYFKKGAAIVEQHFEEDVCLLMIFIPDALMRGTIREVLNLVGSRSFDYAPGKRAIRVENDVTLGALFQSMRTYLASKEKPPEALIRLKLKELVISVLASRSNRALAAYFHQIGTTEAPAVPEIMEANFRYNMALEEYARLCHRSLSSFKREFQAHYNEPPGKWLVQRRLEYAAGLLRNSAMTITQAAFESGFADVSHFSRAFKERFGASPLAYHHQRLEAA